MKNYKDRKKIVMLAVISVILMGMVSVEVYTHLNDDRVIATVRRFKPNVELISKDRAANKGEPLFNGDTLQTDQNGYAAVQFVDNSFAKVKPESQLIIYGEINSDTKSVSSRIALEAGEIFFDVVERNQSDFEVSTSTSVASVKGTEFGASSDSYFWVREGEVELTATISGETADLTRNMFGQVNDDNTITTGELSDDDLQELYDEYERLDEKLTPKTLKLRYRDENGQVQVMEIQYYEN